MNHTQRIAHVARQRRNLTKSLVRDAVERYLEALAEEIARGDWVDIPGIGKMQVSREEGKGYVTSITPGEQHVRHKVQMRLRTKSACTRNPGSDAGSGRGYDYVKNGRVA